VNHLRNGLVIGKMTLINASKVFKTIDELMDEPKVVTHSTSNEDSEGNKYNYPPFNTFDGNRIFNTPNSSVIPIWFSYNGNYVVHKTIVNMPFFLNIKNLFLFNNEKHLKKLQDYMIEKYNNYDVDLEYDYNNNWEAIENENLPAYISEIGFDGYKTDSESAIAIFKSEQGKLADGTNTTFDSKNPDIRFDDGGLTYSEVETRVDNFLQWFENNGWKELSQEEVINAGLGNVDDYFWIEGYTFQSPDKNVLLQFSTQARYILDKYGVFQKIYSRYRDKEPIIMLDTLLVKEKGKGEGTKSIKLITELADKFGVILHLYSKPIPKMEYLNNKELFDFYKKAGFEVLKENEIQKIMVYNPNMRFDEGGELIINPTEIECHKCHWHWKVKDGGDDLFICHKCFTDNSKYYKFEGLEGQKILDNISYSEGGDVTFNYLKNVYKSNSFLYHADFGQNGKITWEIPSMEQKDENGLFNYLIVQSMDSNWNQDETINKIKGEGSRVINDLFESYPFINSILYDDESEGFWTAIGGDIDELKREDFYEYYNKKYKKGGRTIAQTPAPKKDQIKGSDKNKEGSSKDLKSAKKIELSDKTIETIKNKVDKHNEKYPNKKITIDSAKAVVRRGMGAYSSSYRPTISGGKPNSRVAWGLARLNAFLYKIVNGKSKSGKYSQDNDLIEELGYKVQKFSDGGELNDFVLYHGTGNAKKVIEALKDDSFIFHKSAGVENGIYLTSNKKIALDYANDTQGEDMGILEMRFNETPNFKTYNNAGEQYYDEKKYSSNPKEASIEYKKDLIKNNYDGYSTGEVYVLFKEKIDLIDMDKTSVLSNYSDGGDIQAYEDAMGISEFDEGGETKSKKVYVSIRLDNEIQGRFPNYFFNYDEKPFEELKNGTLKGVVGVSSSPNNIAEWFINRDCLIVMDYEQFIAINQTETIDYYDSYQLMKNNLYLFKRLYANITRYGEQEGSYVFTQTLIKILEKIIREINLEMNLAEGQKYSELYRISRFLSPYETKAFPNWIENNEIKIESPVDLTNAILDFNKLNDSYLGQGFANPILTFDELLPVVEKGITNASSIYESEQEIVLINRELNIPKNSQLFFVGKDEVGNDRESNKDELIEKYNLKELYKVYFVDRKEIQKYRDLWLKKEDEKFNKKLEQGREELELKKEQVVEELLDYFLEKSLDRIKYEIEKNIVDYSESLEFYDEKTDDYIEQYWYQIPIVESIFDTYTHIIKNFWKSFIQKKQVKNLDLYAFDMFYFNVKQELKNYFENKKDEIDKLLDYRNVKGSGAYLDPYLFERLLIKSVDDYENLPEWIDYKELSKMYLDKMGRELYRYYDKKDLRLISQYEDGGETEELNLIKNNTMNTNNPKDTITMDIPLLIRYSELMREDIKSDVALHEIVENLLEIKDKGVLTMDDYESVIGNVIGTEETLQQVIQPEEEKMSEGGKLNSIKSKKGDIKISLGEDWYSDDSSVELVPVSELVKFREFDRKVKPKYNQDNSRDNINHLKYMFQKDGVKEPLIIEYSANDNAVIVIEGNHRINSAIDLGMEYLPARVVLKKYSTFTPNQLKNTMKVKGVNADQSGYISSDLKPSQVGIEGTMPIYADGGIIEGRLHSECGDDGCGRKFQVGENGHIIEAERDEAVIVADAFDDNEEYTIEGTPSEVASALNVMGGGKNFDRGATIVKNGEELEIPELKKQAIDTDVDDIIDPNSIIINRRSMADSKEYEVTGTPKQIASAINSLNGNGVVIEKGAEIKEN
jgi:hypothetical protein